MLICWLNQPDNWGNAAKLLIEFVMMGLLPEEKDEALYEPHPQSCKPLREKYQSLSRIRINISPKAFCPTKASPSRVIPQI